MNLRYIAFSFLLFVFLNARPLNASVTKRDNTDKEIFERAIELYNKQYEEDVFKIITEMPTQEVNEEDFSDSFFVIALEPIYSSVEFKIHLSPLFYEPANKDLLIFIRSHFADESTCNEYVNNIDWFKCVKENCSAKYNECLNNKIIDMYEAGHCDSDDYVLKCCRTGAEGICNNIGSPGTEGSRDYLVYTYLCGGPFSSFSGMRCWKYEYPKECIEPFANYIPGGDSCGLCFGNVSLCTEAFLDIKDLAVFFDLMDAESEIVSICKTVQTSSDEDGTEENDEGESIPITLVTKDYKFKAKDYTPHYIMKLMEPYLDVLLEYVRAPSSFDTSQECTGLIEDVNME
ncbi:MAG: hypothetical protein AB1742_09250 [bacterium]